MKKWVVLRRLFFAFCSVLLAIVLPIISTRNASAVSVGPSIFGLSYRAPSSSSYTWNTNLYAGFDYKVYANYVNGVRIGLSSTSFTGNYASIHTEVNIVSAENVRHNQWVNLKYQAPYTVARVGSGNLKIEQSSCSSAITPWTTTGSYPLRSTLTLYCDVTVSGLPQGSSGEIAMLIGNTSYAFADSSVSPSYYYVEKAVTNIEFSTNINDALLNTQVQQNQQMINNQQEMLEQQQQTNNQLQDMNDWLSDSSSPDVDTSGLGDSAGWLPAGPVDSIVTLPVSFIQGIVNLFTGQNTCSPLSLKLPIFKEPLEIPCLYKYFEQTGFNVIWNTAGGVISAFMILYTLKWLYDYVDATLTFRENNSGIWGGL